MPGFQLWSASILKSISCHLFLCEHSSYYFTNSTAQIFGGKFYKQLQVLEMVYLCIFCVNFICMLAKLCRLEFFKSIYLETSDVQFRLFFQNPVTIIIYKGNHKPWYVTYIPQCGTFDLHHRCSILCET